MLLRRLKSGVTRSKMCRSGWGFAPSLCMTGLPSFTRMNQNLKNEDAGEIRHLKAELRRVTEERDISKKGHGVLCKAGQVKYAFIRGAPHGVFRAGHVPRFACSPERVLCMAQVWFEP